MIGIHVRIFCNIMVVPPFYNMYYGINTNCYDLWNVRQPIVYSVEGVIKWGSNSDVANVLSPFTGIRLTLYKSSKNIKVIDPFTISSILLIQKSLGNPTLFRCMENRPILLVLYNNTVIQHSSIYHEALLRLNPFYGVTTHAQ